MGDEVHRLANDLRWGYRDTTAMDDIALILDRSMGREGATEDVLHLTLAEIVGVVRRTGR